MASQQTVVKILLNDLAAGGNSDSANDTTTPDSLSGNATNQALATGMASRDTQSRTKPYGLNGLFDTV